MEKRDLGDSLEVSYVVSGCLICFLGISSGVNFFIEMRSVFGAIEDRV